MNRNQTVKPMRHKEIALIALLSVNIFCYSQEKIVELPLTVQNGYSTFSMSFGGMSPISEIQNHPLEKTFPKISNFPEGLTDMKWGFIETNILQSVYQDYLLGNIPNELYEQIQKSWNWTPDTINLSKTPIKTKIVFAFGANSEEILKVAVDANNNLDLSDDKLFTPIDRTSAWSKRDTLALTHAVEVSFETFVHNKIVPASAPLVIIGDSRDMMYNFSQHLTTQFNGEPIAVSTSFTDLSYENIRVAITSNDLKNVQSVDREDVYRKNEYIEIKDETYKILGVNTNNNTLALERIDLPKIQLFSTQVGYKPHPFQGEEFTKKTPILLEDFQGKCVLLDFWAEWCGPCIAEFPHLKELYSKTDRTKFEIIGIAGQSSSNGIKRLIEQHELTWSQILSDNIVKMYGITSFPTTILLDAEGIIVAKNLTGFALERKILELIGE